MADFKATLIRDADGTTASVEPRTQTPTKSDCLHVMIGPGDVIGNIPVIIDYSHHQNHEGEAHLFFKKSSLNGTVHYRLSVPTLLATKATPHVIFEIITDGVCDATLYEDTTWTALGQEQTTFNRNRNSAVASSMKVYATGTPALTVNAQGTAVSAWYLNANKNATNVNAESEIILKSNTEYDLVLVTGANTSIMLRINWYEDLGV